MFTRVLLTSSSIDERGACRSNIVGRPMSELLLRHDGTVTVCHSRTADLKSIVQTADILICAVGQPQMVKGDWLKPGCVVIDAGISAIPDPSKKSGTRLVGDADFEECAKVCGWRCLLVSCALSRAGLLLR